MFFSARMIPYILPRTNFRFNKSTTVWVLNVWFGYMFRTNLLRNLFVFLCMQDPVGQPEWSSHQLGLHTRVSQVSSFTLWKLWLFSLRTIWFSTEKSRIRLRYKKMIKIILDDPFLGPIRPHLSILGECKLEKIQVQESGIEVHYFPNLYFCTYVQSKPPGVQ